MSSTFDDEVGGRFFEEGLEPFELPAVTALGKGLLSGWWRASFASPGTQWFGAASEGTSYLRQLTPGTPNTTTPVYRGANIVAYGARGYWGNWSGANTAGTTYAAKAGNGPTLTADFTNSYGTTQVDYLISKGMNFFRVLINHEALQPEPYAAIPYAGAFTNASRYVTYWNAVKALVDYIVLTKGCTVLLDFHNAESLMAGYYNKPFRVTPGAGEEDSDILEDAWAKLATIFSTGSYAGAASQKVWFGIHNEPNGSDGGGYTTANWFPIVQGVINAIRATGNTSKILVPGLDYTASRAWVYNGSAAAYLTLTDSANNLGVQVHLYFDANNGGGGTTIAHTNPDFGTTIANNQAYEPKDRLDDGTAASDEQVGLARILQVCAWAEVHGVEVYITENGASTLNESNVDQTTKLTNTVNNMFDFMDAHPLTMKGYCWWQSGYTAGHLYTIDQYSGTDSPMMAIIAPHMVSALPIPAASAAFDPYAALASNGRLEEIFLNYDPADALNTAGTAAPADGAEIGSLPCKPSLGLNSLRNLARVASNGLRYKTASTNLNSKPTMGPTSTTQKLAATFDTTLAQAYTTYTEIYLPSTFSVKAFFRTFNGNYDGSPGLTFAATTRAPSIQVKTTAGQAVTGGSIAAGKHWVCCVYNGSSAAIYIDDPFTPFATGTIDSNALATVTYGSYGSAPPAWEAGIEFVMQGADGLTDRVNMWSWYTSSSRYGT